MKDTTDLFGGMSKKTEANGNKKKNQAIQTHKGKNASTVVSKEDGKKLNLIQNYSAKDLEEILLHQKLNDKPNGMEIITEEIGHAIFGAIGDTHLGSKHCNYDGLNKYYDKLQDRGIKTVLHAGDMVDGFGVYKGQTFELSKHSMEEQIEDVVTNYPKRDGIDTYFIGGNHDEARLKVAGYDIGKALDGLREDLHYLGFYNARIKINGVDCEIHHGGGSQSYAQSYKLQKMLENEDPKNQPHVFLLGHFHTAMYMFYRKIHSLMVGAFQGENLLSKRFKLGNTNGGWTVEVWLDNQGGTKINLEFIKV